MIYDVIKFKIFNDVIIKCEIDLLVKLKVGVC